MRCYLQGKDYLLYNINQLPLQLYIWKKINCELCNVLAIAKSHRSVFATWCAVRAMDWANIQLMLERGKISGTVKWLADKRSDKFHLFRFK
jgi:hypothetical protein